MRECRNGGLLFEQEQVFAKLFDVCEVCALDAEERKEYGKDMTTQWDIDDRINGAYLKGEAEGEAKVARAMLADGMNKSLVAKYTGLTLEKISELQSNKYV